MPAASSKASRAATEAARAHSPGRVGSVSNARETGLSGAEREVFDRLHAAILEQRLPPGAKLGEEQLAEIYGMSRMRVRRILLSLSHERVVSLFAGRGAFVASPTPDEARSVFEARRVIECAVLDEMTRPAGAALVTRLRRNVAAERDAARHGDRAGAIRLSGAFHVEIMAELGNPTIAAILDGLVSRSSLVIALYQRADAPACAEEDHARLAEVLGSRRFRRAAELMRAHLAQIEATLVLQPRQTHRIDLRDVLRPAAKPAGGGRRLRPAMSPARAKRASRPSL